MRNLTDEEAKIYDSWLNSEAIDTGFNLFDEISLTIEKQKSGEWVESSIPQFMRCSECGAFWDRELVDNMFFIYCPRCGSQNRRRNNGKVD